MSKQRIDPGTLIGEIMEQWPQTVPVFIKYQMGCAGCSLAKFETLDDAMKNYQTPVEEFLREIDLLLKDG